MSPRTSTRPDTALANMAAARARAERQAKVPDQLSAAAHRARVTPPDAPMQLNRIIRERELFNFTGLRKTQVAALIRAGEFPKPIKLTETGRAKGWLEVEILSWQLKRLAQREAT